MTGARAPACLAAVEGGRGLDGGLAKDKVSLCHPRAAVMRIGLHGQAPFWRKCLAGKLSQSDPWAPCCARSLAFRGGSAQRQATSLAILVSLGSKEVRGGGSCAAATARHPSPERTLGAEPSRSRTLKPVGQLPTRPATSSPLRPGATSCGCGPGGSGDATPRCARLTATLRSWTAVASRGGSLVPRAS